MIQSFKDAAAQSFYTALYLQDDWRATRKLTLNLGLRYDLDSPRTERFDRMNYFNPNAASPLAGQRGGLIFVGVDGRPRSQYNWDKSNFAQRIGFAYRLTDKTTIRGGWGNFDAPSPQQAHGTVGPFGFRTQTPWVGSVDGITPNDLLSNPFPRGFTQPPGSSQRVQHGSLQCSEHKRCVESVRCDQHKGQCAASNSVRAKTIVVVGVVDN